MALIVENKVIPGTYPVVYRHAEVFPGGYRLMNTLPVGYVIPRGAYLCITPGKLEANICKVATVIAGGTAQAVKVAKGHPFVKGDVVMLSGTAKAIAISDIDVSKVDFDTLSFASELTGGDKVGILIEADGAGENGKTAKHIPNSFVDVEQTYKDGDTVVSGASRGMLIAGNIDTPAEYLNGICMKGNPNILIVAQ